MDSRERHLLKHILSFGLAIFKTIDELPEVPEVPEVGGFLPVTKSMLTDCPGKSQNGD